jgi:hypothetical protein
MVLGVALVLVAAACGGGDDDDGAQNSHTTGTVPGAHDDGVEVAAADRCDLGFNTAKYNETTEQVGHFHEDDAPHMGGHHEIDYTIEEWAAVFAGDGVLFTPEALADFAEANEQLNQAVTSGSLTTTLKPDPWVPMTDPEECTALAAELQRVRAAIAKYPTVADAVAAGYKPGSQAAPGQGAHYTRIDLIDLDTFDPEQPAQLMYAGSQPASALIGAAHLMTVSDGKEPEGLPGANDRWHLHASMCLNASGEAVGADLPEDACSSLGGTVEEGPGGGTWMLHTWLVPGCESDWGMFSNANPRFPVLAPDTPFKTGCNSGRTVADPLTLADPGSGPDLNATR